MDDLLASNSTFYNIAIQKGCRLSVMERRAEKKKINVYHRFGLLLVNNSALRYFQMEALIRLNSNIALLREIHII